MKEGISLCMIVRDESEFLERCLASVREIIDEIIIVDTGSADDSVAIAQRYDATIISTEWNGDFSQARNLSLAAASFTWILVLDADEMWMHTLWTKSELMEWLEAGSEESWGYWVKVTSLLGNSGEERVTDEVCRLFRNDPRIAFHGRIHEEVASSILALMPQGIHHSDIEVVHYGYLDKVIATKRKDVRNMRLIRLALQQTPDQQELLYALAAEWFQQAKYDEAIRLLLPLLAKLDPTCGYHSDVVLKTAYTWRELGQIELALSVVENWVTVYDDFPDLLELAAVLELDQNRADRALEWLKQAKSAASTAGRYTSVSGAGSYRSLTLEGMAHEQDGRWAEAEASYTEALCIQPGSVVAWQRMLLLGAATGRPQAIAGVAEWGSLPLASWQALVSVALATHRPEWLLRHAWTLGPVQREQPLAEGLALAQIGEDAAARAALRLWAAHAQHGPEAALALWALGHKQRERGVPGRAAATRQRVAVPEVAHAAEALLQDEGAATCGAYASSMALPAQALAAVGAWPAWLRLLQALPPGGALALLAALPPAARCGLLRAPAHVRAWLLALCGTPSGAQQPCADEVPAPALAAHALLAGTLALLARRQSLARDWADNAARITARHAAAQGRPAKTPPPGLQTLLRLTASGAAHAPAFQQQCNMLLVYL
ncbi:Glycosyltransferase involved in cell wall bisynthesis [Paenibacillus polysaccharolyticus]|uniref:Glycosyltransferase involved in cell wall bisynthesis n=1 Tax=Paenibacillus polysaccharolyticus TaxID=582692 RepID=A0A1G5JBK7_9BACL|nr:glycosyltransferase [Paenibacillus polysaccharolyticus]SCY85340.1 Glycosyltransferase involved in cell wall bisynthesis [Paenibacillus polysaccharolyticus]